VQARAEAGNPNNRLGGKLAPAGAAQVRTEGAGLSSDGAPGPWVLRVPTFD